MLHGNLTKSCSSAGTNTVTPWSAVLWLLLWIVGSCSVLIQTLIASYSGCFDPTGCLRKVELMPDLPTLVLHAAPGQRPTATSRDIWHNPPWVLAHANKHAWRRAAAVAAALTPVKAGRGEAAE